MNSQILSTTHDLSHKINKKIFSRFPQPQKSHIWFPALNSKENTKRNQKRKKKREKNPAPLTQTRHDLAHFPSSRSCPFPLFLLPRRTSAPPSCSINISVAHNPANHLPFSLYKQTWLATATSLSISTQQLPILPLSCGSNHPYFSLELTAKLTRPKPTCAPPFALIGPTSWLTTSEHDFPQIRHLHSSIKGARQP